MRSLSFSVDQLISWIQLRLSDQEVVRRFLVGYLLLLVVYLLALNLSMPIGKTDADMWYHMNGGRYFWSTGEVPDTTFFSFLEPPREWINYYWGFQAVVYKTYELFGYQGLVVVRALLVTLTVSVVLLFVFHPKEVREKPALFIILATLFLIILLSRTSALRPHLISYLFIAVYVYVLQYRTRYAPMLPFLTVVWVNMHGVEWVVGALIAGAYLVEHVHTRHKLTGSYWNLDKRYVVSILASGIALLVNPYGVRVVTSSFAHDQDIYLFVKELQQINPELLYSLSVSLFDVDMMDSLTVLLAIEAMGVLMLAFRHKLRVSHAIMAIGGAYLLSKGLRFAWEWALLTLPLVHSIVLEYEFSIAKSKHKYWRYLFASYFALLPFVVAAKTIEKFGYYPFDPSGLPVATVEFLKQKAVSGNVVAHPVTSGYLEWALYPEMLIYSDMEYPPFQSFDLYKMQWMQNDGHSLTSFLDSYTVDYLVVERDNPGFTRLIEKHPNFVPIFFDDSSVIYANKVTQTQLVEQGKLEAVNPFNIFAANLRDEKVVAELERVFSYDPNGRNITQAMTRIMIAKGRFDDALVYAKRFVSLHPEDSNSHYWLGKTLENLGRYDAAIVQYKEAVGLSESDRPFAENIEKRIAGCAFVLKEFEESYYWFSRSINPYKSIENPVIMYQYAYAAAIVDDPAKAISILDMMLWSLDPNEKELREKAEAFRQSLIEANLADLGIVSWLQSLIK